MVRRRWPAKKTGMTLVLKRCSLGRAFVGEKFRRDAQGLFHQLILFLVHPIILGWIREGIKEFIFIPKTPLCGRV
jgi:hypothetical protein